MDCVIFYDMHGSIVRPRSGMGVGVAVDLTNATKFSKTKQGKTGKAKPNLRPWGSKSMMYWYTNCVRSTERGTHIWRRWPKCLTKHLCSESTPWAARVAIFGSRTLVVV